MPNALVQHLGHRRDAVGGARRVGEHVVLRGVVLVLVHAQDNGQVLAGGRGGDDDLADGVVDVGCGPLGLGENASGLYHNLGAHLAPGDLGWVSLGEDADGPLIDHEIAVADHDGAGEAAVVGVVLEQVGIRVAVSQVVHRNDFQV